MMLTDTQMFVVMFGAFACGLIYTYHTVEVFVKKLLGIENEEENKEADFGRGLHRTIEYDCEVLRKEEA